MRCFQNQTLYNVLVFWTWTLTSFLCHRFGKSFLASMATAALEGKSPMPGEDHVVTIAKMTDALLLTAVQLAFCRVFVYLDEGAGSNNERTIKLCHALATFATNVSMALMFASSTFAIKMMEPVTSAIVQYLMMGSPLSPLAVTSLPIIVGGAIIFAGNPLELSNASLGMVAALISNLILAIRNVSLKQAPDDGARLQLNMKGRYLLTPITVVTMILSTSMYLETCDILPSQTTLRLLCTSVSGLFHVMYSYVSMALVLTKISVVSHSVANIMKRLLVVLLLYAAGQRQATTWNFLGLLLCTFGLLVYVWDKSRSQTRMSVTDVKRDPRQPRKIFTYLTYGFFAFGFLGLATFSIPRYQSIPTMLRKEASDAFYRFSDVQPGQKQMAFGRMEWADHQKLLPNVDVFPEVLTEKILPFLNLSLSEHPSEANFVSETLAESSEIIKESQRIHFNVIGKELKHFKYAILFDIAAFENKGDPCITAGEIYFLSRMNIEIVYYCNARGCTDHQLKQAVDLAKRYSPRDLVILVHGGGNIIGYALNDILRFKIINLFSSTFKIMVFPQSIWIRMWNHPHVKRTSVNYCCNSNLTIVLRDALSYSIAKQLYNGTTRLLMAPDMAFQIGHVPRSMSPVFDIMWIKRKDGETPGYSPPTSVPKHLRVHISDWWKWTTPRAGTTLEKAFYIVTNGFFFLQRGRVVVTDRLHGHIMSVLMDIPHVLIDNKAKKLSSYHATWTRSLKNTVITDDPSKALELAIELLNKYNKTLPSIVPHLNLREDFSMPKLGVPDSSYP